MTAPDYYVRVDCDSCGGDATGEPGAFDCGGCGRTICPSCCDVFGHWAGGAHGLGDPGEHVRSLAAHRDRLREAIKRLIAASENVAGALGSISGDAHRAYLDSYGDALRAALRSLGRPECGGTAQDSEDNDGL